MTPRHGQRGPVSPPVYRATSQEVAWKEEARSIPALRHMVVRMNPLGLPLKEMAVKSIETKPLALAESGKALRRARAEFLG